MDQESWRHTDTRFARGEEVSEGLGKGAIILILWEGGGRGDGVPKVQRTFLLRSDEGVR